MGTAGSQWLVGRTAGELQIYPVRRHWAGCPHFFTGECIGLKEHAHVFPGVIRRAKKKKRARAFNNIRLLVKYSRIPI